MICSAGLHASLIAVAVVGLPRLWEQPPLPEIIAVELVNLTEPEEAETPEPQAQAKPEPEPEPPPPPQAAKPEPPPPAPPEPPALAKPEPEPEPPKVAEPKPKPLPPEEVAKAPPEPAPEPKPAVPPEAQAKAPPPMPRRKPVPKPRPDELQTLLKNLARQHEAQRAQQRQHTPSDRLAAAAPEAAGLSPIERQRIAADLAQQVKRQVTPCWSIPAGIKDAAQMRIGVRIYLNPDGSLRGNPRIEDQRRLDGDTGYRAVAESALRALRNPRCSPLRLPIKQYELWQEITFNFDPRELLDQ